MSHPTLDFKRAYLALRRALEHTVKSFGFTGGQFDVLQVLMHDDGLEHRELQRRLAVSSPTLTNVIDVLERQGHVVRRSDHPDARVKSIHLTDAAWEICTSPDFCDAGHRLVEQMFEGFSDTDRARFLDYLGRVERNLDGVEKSG